MMMRYPNDDDDDDDNENNDFGDDNDDNEKEAINDDQNENNDNADEMTTSKQQACMLCAGGEGEGCEDCSDKGAAGEAVPSVLQYGHPAQVHLLFDPNL